MELADLRAFTRIADFLSVSGAARAMGLPKSAVSRSLARLERQVGTVLIDRSTRHLRLTDAGLLFRPHAQRILADVDEAMAVLDEQAGEPFGTLRVSLPFTLAFAVVTPMLPAFMAAFPKVKVVLAAENRFIDMPAEPFDLAIRVGSLPDSDLIARRLVLSKTWICASPAYLAENGTPGTAADLQHHAVIDYTEQAVTYELSTAPAQRSEPLAPRAVVSDAAAMLPLVLGGGGIARLPDFLARPFCRDGRLVRLWTAGEVNDVPIHAVYPSHRGMSAKVRHFIDALLLALRPEPD